MIEKIFSLYSKDVNIQFDLVCIAMFEYIESLI